MSAQPVRPLDGYRVVSLAEQYPGPFATMVLGDLGADVVQVERPQGGDPSRAFPGHHAALNRGKRSVALDLKTPSGLAACRALVARADVLVEGFRPGVLDRLGLSPADLTRDHPGLVVVSVSGFGQDGPYRDRPAHDLSFQAVAGLLDAEAPVVPQVALADVAAGLFAAIAALTGLAGRATGGRGGHYDVGMFDALVSFVVTRLVPVANGMPADALGQDPGYGLFATADGRWISLSIVFEDHFWRALCAVSGLDALAGLTAPERAARRDGVRAELARRIAAEPLAHWERVLPAAGVAYGAVQDLAGLVEDPHLRGRGLLQTVEGRRHLRQPLVVDGTAPGPRSGVPGLGAHTGEVLREAGVAEETVAAVLGAALTGRG
ncbi:CaiB/BaiF CoA transferase family protein [Pseudonocardia broussonetiae]|uniref:CoA transferase n=1 Tax=Pseudonocardia broussonetiae TaxID=2736640 RepID=A0A6M6JA69_9PSEU|nr:CaiB/BaiF CoA-transferase family protein [Pseudonocardia broussonetiae]QJY44496.1 CoA transferase [Pseudonocardia broussonetiae]